MTLVGCVVYEGGTMGSFTVDECFECGRPVEPAAGNYYCDECVSRQLRGAVREAEAFDAFHAYADERQSV